MRDCPIMIYAAYSFYTFVNIKYIYYRRRGKIRSLLFIIAYRYAKNN